jgi:hypothetical protein
MRSAGDYAGFVVTLEGRGPTWWCENEYVRAGAFEASSLIVVQRSALRLRIDGLALALRDLFQALGPVKRGAHALLIDSRAAPGENDADFERVYARYRARLVEGWSRTGVLVQSVAGKLQLQRHQGEGLAVEVFSDQTQAVSWLLAPQKPR